ncbi:MAG: ferredoxin [Candidatus Aenigmarchaeota archaeon ex4484_56]|nr:MAG: ferredoxin [Candidatus Aenigmarchaeota archaeon ex4484_56]
MQIDKEKCLRCGGCVGVCPKGALELTEQGIKHDKNLCIYCKICEKFCPMGAIKLEDAT